MIIAIVRKLQNNSYSFIGTGFFVNESGLFISCGHNFQNLRNNHSSYFCAIQINDNYANIYSIDSLRFEYNIFREPGEEYIPTDPPSQKPPINRDLAIGQVSQWNTIHYILNRKRPNYGCHLNAIGYRNHEGSNLLTNHSNQLDISNLKIIEAGFSIMLREYAIFSKVKGFFKMEPSSVSKVYKYNNTLMLKDDEYSAENDRLAPTGKGMSGCPVIDSNNLVVGIYLGKKESFNIHYLLLSKYITKYIDYRTHYKYDTYSDLPIRMQ